jgi:ABC-type glycerol-3-phosphate transport system substrate-binding protein
MSNEGKHQDEAWEFLKWLCTDGVKKITEFYFQFLPVQANDTVNVSNFTPEEQKNILEVIRITQERAYGYREIAYPRLKQAIADQLKAIAIGESTPRQAAEIIETASKAERR